MEKSPTIVQVSVVGARDINEDRVAQWSAPDALLMAVADGLGGHMHGEVAAQVAVDVLGAAFLGEARQRLEDPTGFLPRSLAAAHAAIVREGEKRRLPDNPRTVIAACVVQEDRVYWTHVGDCRFYLLRAGRVLARSRDHTIVQRLVDEGRIREEAMATHPHRNRLLACLGGFHMPRIEPVTSVVLQRDDIVLLCSDGFWGPLNERQLVEAIASRPLAEAIQELVAVAEVSTGPDCDNVSVVAMAWN